MKQDIVYYFLQVHKGHTIAEPFPQKLQQVGALRAADVNSKRLTRIAVPIPKSIQRCAGRVVVERCLRQVNLNCIGILCNGEVVLKATVACKKERANELVDLLALLLADDNLQHDAGSVMITRHLILETFVRSSY
eukprot:scaffold1518_cov417-Prasinococcus_capsulatus_cf.AAC.22